MSSFFLCFASSLHIYIEKKPDKTLEPLLSPSLSKEQTLSSIAILLLYFKEDEVYKPKLFEFKFLRCHFNSSHHQLAFG
jgi:hypothetical protein